METPTALLYSLYYCQCYCSLQKYSSTAVLHFARELRRLFSFSLPPPVFSFGCRTAALPGVTTHNGHGLLGVLVDVALRIAARKSIHSTVDPPCALLSQLASTYSKICQKEPISDNSDDRQTPIDGARFCAGRPPVSQVVCRACLLVTYATLLHIFCIKEHQARQCTFVQQHDNAVPAQRRVRTAVQYDSL